MAYTVDWHDEARTAVLITYDGEMDWAAFYASISRAHELINSVTHTVDLIIEDRAGLPPGNPMIHFQNAFKHQPLNTGRVYVAPKAGKSAVTAFMKQLANVLGKVLPGKASVIFVSSVDEARQRMAPGA